MMRKGRFALVLTICLVTLCLLGVPEARCAELSITGATVAPGESFTTTVMVDSVEGLAGLKIVIDYDPSIITYRRGAKTNQTDAMMHVINDKTPGRLILVMAAATGISGKDLPLFTFIFTARENTAIKQEIFLNIAELELMSDALKNINAQYRAESITIIPD